MKKKLTFQLIWMGTAVVTLLSLTGCQRSKAYQYDQDYYSDVPSYYDKTGSSTDEVRKLEKVGQPKKRVVVLAFFNDTPLEDFDLGGFAADELRRGLFLSKKVIIPEQATLQFGTKDFLQGDRIKVAQLIREGRRMGVSILVIGKIAKMVFRQTGDEIGVFRKRHSFSAVEAEVKIFDVQGGREITAIGRQGKASTTKFPSVEEEKLQSQRYRAELGKVALRDAIRKLVPGVIRSIDKLSWQGRIAKIEGNRIYLNAGRTSGLIGGDILRVLTTGEDVYDPESGSYLGRTAGRLKGTLEVVDFLGKDGAIAIIHTGGQFSKGDVVRLY